MTVTDLRRALEIPDDGPTGLGIRIAVLDSGIDASHEDLREAVDGPGSRDCTVGTPPGGAPFAPAASHALRDVSHHGTHLAGIMAGRGKTALSGRGVAPDAVLLSLRVMPPGIMGELAPVKGVRAACGAGADILNFSNAVRPLDPVTQQRLDPPLVWSAHPTLLEEALTDAAAAGMLCVIAAGNDDPERAPTAFGAVRQPAGLHCVLSVGAVDKSGIHCPFSSGGPYVVDHALALNEVQAWDGRWTATLATETTKPDLCALGASLAGPHSAQCARQDCERARPATDAPAAYLVGSGTSQAAAVVSGLAACALQWLRDRGLDVGRNPGKTLRRLLCDAARDAGAGRLKADRYRIGAGVLRWPTLHARLMRYESDPAYRTYAAFAD